MRVAPTCEVLLSELDQWENHAVSHLVGQLRVERIQLEPTKQIYIQISSGAQEHQQKMYQSPNILRDFNLFYKAQ